MSSLPDIGTFVKHDPQRFVVGSLANQIRVLIQRMKMRGYQPWKILLSPGLRFALRSEVGGTMEYAKHDQHDMFLGLPIVLDTTVREPIMMIKPERRTVPLEKGFSTSEERVWRRGRNAEH
jgi:hypothetical protein